jgi:hypothetical protein
MEEQDGIKTTFKIQTSSSRSRWLTTAAAYAGQFPQRKIKRIVFCSYRRHVYRLGSYEWGHRRPLDSGEGI